MTEDKAVKAFVEMSHNKLSNPYNFADKIRLTDRIAADFLHKVSVGWFRLMEIEYRYGIGDPLVGEMGARIVHEVLADYEELPEYNTMRGFEGGSGDTSRTWKHSEPNVSQTIIGRGYAS